MTPHFLKMGEKEVNSLAHSRLLLLLFLVASTFYFSFFVTLWRPIYISSGLGSTTFAGLHRPTSLLGGGDRGGGIEVGKIMMWLSGAAGGRRSENT